MTNDWMTALFDEHRDEHFATLCTNLGLTDLAFKAGPEYAIASAKAGNVRVFFEHDRGLCQFAVAAAVEEGPFCSIEEIADRFPRIRSLKGHQRLSLSEQRQFVEDHWSELQLT
jgi:hypothetical protein